MSLARKCDRCGSFYIPESRKKNRGGVEESLTRLL